MTAKWNQCKSQVLMIDANNEEEVTFCCTNRDGQGHLGQHYNTCREYQYLWGEDKKVTLMKDGYVYDKEEKQWVVNDLFYPAEIQ